MLEGGSAMSASRWETLPQLGAQACAPGPSSSSISSTSCATFQRPSVMSVEPNTRVSAAGTALTPWGSTTRCFHWSAIADVNRNNMRLCNIYNPATAPRAVTGVTGQYPSRAATGPRAPDSASRLESTLRRRSALGVNAGWLQSGTRVACTCSGNSFPL